MAAAAPYMQEQLSPLHFEFFGIDVIADSMGASWLVEANRYNSSTSNASHSLTPHN